MQKVKLDAIDLRILRGPDGHGEEKGRKSRRSRPKKARRSCPTPSRPAGTDAQQLRAALRRDA